jgi:hypothetical protein
MVCRCRYEVLQVGAAASTVELSCAWLVASDAPVSNRYPAAAAPKRGISEYWQLVRPPRASSWRGLASPS